MKRSASATPTALAAFDRARWRLGAAVKTSPRRRLLLLLAGLGLLLAGIGTAQPVGDFAYTNQSGAITITHYTGKSASAVVIPATLAALPVVEIGSDAFKGHREMVSVTIPEGVTHIADRAFNSCAGLTHVTIPNGVVSIGVQAFEGATALKSVTIPGSIASIGFGAFRWSGLTSVTIPNGVTHIGPYAFSSCLSLGAIAVDPQNPAYSSREGVLFDQGLTTLIQYPPTAPAASYIIPTSVTRIGEDAVVFCSKLRSLTIPDSVTDIGQSAFGHCSGLTRVTIPRSVTGIGAFAFVGCSGLTSVTIPRSVTTLGNTPFNSCTNLVSIDVESGSAIAGSREGVLFNRDQTVLLQYPAGLPADSYTLPAGVTAIDSEAFMNCNYLENVTIPRSVTSIGGDAFLGCWRLVGAYFAGNAPAIVDTRWEIVFNSLTVAYYLPGTTGWAATFAGNPTAVWVLPNPVILNAGARPEPSAEGFGFTLSWAINATLVVEAASTLDSPTWSPISTHTIRYTPGSTDVFNGWASFNDPEWRSHPTRFYRLRGE